MAFSALLFSTPLLLGALLTLALSLMLTRWYSSTRKLPYPPGPPEKSSVAGNMSDYPTAFAQRTYMEWGRKYGGIVHYRVYHKHIIVLNSYEDNVELLEKRSAIYADRPYMPMLDLMGWLSFDFGFMPYGPLWRSHRRVFQQHFKPEASLRYQPTQTSKVQDMLYGLLTTPEDFMTHYRNLGGAIIMSIIYAHDVAPKDDYFVDLAEKAMAQIVAGVSYGAYLFEAFPSMRYIPSWFPGAGFKRFALAGRKLAFDMRDIPLGIVQEQMKEGAAPNCIAAELLDKCQSKDEFDIIAGVSAIGYVAGADTTVALLGTFFQAMWMHPDVQRRASKELDDVVGSKRLVNFDDRPSLPYVEAVFREVLRWRPVVPLSVPHGNTSDDIYKGYYIPKGAIIISNLWAIARNPERYPDPETFNPSRFFKENGLLNDDDVGFVFGFGRRICPGRHLGAASVWLAIATVLQNFNIEQKLDCEGKLIPTHAEYKDELILHPLPFQCSITPRSTEARRVILQAVGKPS